MKIVHVMIFEKFIRSYIEFLDENFEINDHVFLVIGKDYNNYNLSDLPNVYFIKNIQRVPVLIWKLYVAKKIIIHGLWNRRFIKVLLLQPWLIKKCYWMMWGGDFYNYENETKEKKRLIKIIRHFVGFVRSDFDFVKKYYDAKGIFHYSVFYPVAFFEDFDIALTRKLNYKIKILVGNSADPSNNHFEILEQLKYFKNEPIEIIVPLSYGNLEYAELVIKKGVEIYNEKFKPLTNFLRLEEYQSLLKSIDIGIFNHNRQQGAGNILPLLNAGTKVYLRKGTPMWKMFDELNVIVFDNRELNIELLKEDIKIKNREVMKMIFSKNKYIEDLTILFYN